jgi:hypothetical protein
LLMALVAAVAVDHPICLLLTPLLAFKTNTRKNYG